MRSLLEIAVLNQAELPGLAEPVLRLYDDPKIILFDAPMGAGKTTFIKEICHFLGSTDNFSSPSYAIVNEYICPGGKIYHFDLYRVKSSEELLDLGIEEYLNSGHYCLFEWPELIEDMINVRCKKIEIKVKENIRYLRIINK